MKLPGDDRRVAADDPALTADASADASADIVLDGESALSLLFNKRL